ncbi:lactose permease [Hyaloscypha sp. PMI_1271]|nr:lactose permease [Hyaloscypha sp. PMI_1271]
MAIYAHEIAHGDPVLTRIVDGDNVPWYKKRNLRTLYLLLFPACMGIEMTSGFDSQLINTLQFAPPFLHFFGNGYRDPATHKYAIKPALLGIIGASYSLGGICAVPLAPSANQWFGRRWSIITGSLTMICGGIIQGCAQDAAMYIVARMILGFGIVFCIVSGSAMIGELAYPKERAIVTSLFNSSYFIGAVVASAVSLKTAELTTTWAWRIPSVLQISPSLFQLIFVFMLPESPRYLISKDRDDEALEILMKYHAEGDRDSLFVRAEMAQIRTTIKTELEYARQSWWGMLKTSGMRKRVYIAAMIGLFTQWSGNTLLSYYLSDILSMMGRTSVYAKTRINISQNCWGVINGTIASLIVTRFPRRRMFLISLGGMLLVYIGLTTSIEQFMSAKAHGKGGRVASILALFFIFAHSPMYNIGNNALTYTYLVELFPFAERARGISVEQFFGRAAGFFSTYVNPIALKAITWKYFAVYVGWIAVEAACVYFFYPETHGRTLEELSFLFEDRLLADNVARAVEKQLYYDERPGKQAVTHLEESIPYKRFSPHSL